MTTITHEAQITHVADLLGSLKDSVWDLRKTAQRLVQQIEAGEHAEIGSGSKELSQSKGLVAVCQKMEAHLAELETQRDGTGQGGYALDLHEAASEVGRRLDRIRDDGGAGRVSD